MCGRFTLRTPAAVLIEQFALEVHGGRQLPLFEPRYNIAPTQDVVVVRIDPAIGRREAVPMRWGLVPPWSKAPGEGPPLINARGETLAEKPTFRTAYRRRRCMILADGFYEWQKSPGGGRGKKQPYYIHRPDNRPFAFAGLWEIWSPKRSAEGFAPESDQGGAPSSISSCTIVTTDANERLREIHDRMPVVLSAADYSLWLDPATEDPATLANLLVPCDEDELIAEPVSTHVNQVANDDPQCISVQRSLFN